MSTSLVTVTPETNLEDCCRAMEDHQIRRVPVVDEQGACCGIVSLADIAARAAMLETAELVKEVSHSTPRSQ